MRRFRLRTKFLLSFLAVTTGLTAATLWIVSYSVEKRTRELLRDELKNSVRTYESLATQQETMLVHSAALVANLPNVRALMTTQDAATIQDEADDIRRLSGSDLLVLASRTGEVLGLQAKSQDFSRDAAAKFLRDSLGREEGRNWWLGCGHLYEVWVSPIYFGTPGEGPAIGLLAVGHKIDDRTAQNFRNIVSSDIVFQSAGATVASSLSATAVNRVFSPDHRNAPVELELGRERYLATTVDLSAADGPQVTLSVLRSLDKATSFLNRLNHILLAMGLASVLAGGLLVFGISHTFTKPLSNLVLGVHALQAGDFAYPLQPNGGDEVGEVTQAFDRMRSSMAKAQTEQQQLEDRLRQAHKMEAIGRLAGGVAHDFNNLLTVIRGNGDLLLDRSASDSGSKKYVEQIQKAADRAVSMTRQLLAFSRMQVLQPRVVDLNAIVAEMNKMIPRLIGEHIEFCFLPQPNLASVLADPGQMEQVLLNLAVNARDAMPGGGKIIVQTQNVVVHAQQALQRPPMTAGEYVLLSVSDTGCGMDAETKAKIFEPFFTTKEVGKGTGLGLATVYGIVKQSGGFIWVESEKGKGATFQIYVPVSQKRPPEASGPHDIKVVPGGTETILVVEDEPGVRELASEFLRSGGYTVLEAHDGREGFSVATHFPDTIHLVLTDLVMPHANGTELVKKLLALKPELRVIYMTGYAEFSEKNFESLLGRSPVLQKPFSRASLLEKVREVLGTAPHRQPSGTKA